MPSGKGRYKLMAADLVATHSMMDHIGRYLPSVRMNGAAFSFVVDLIINYGSPVLHLVMVRGLQLGKAALLRLVDGVVLEREKAQRH
jgi:hypothetical protein